jgi:hypothetical protein
MFDHVVLSVSDKVGYIFDAVLFYVLQHYVPLLLQQ